MRATCSECKSDKVEVIKKTEHKLDIQIKRKA